MTGISITPANSTQNFTNGGLADPVHRDRELRRGPARRHRRGSPGRPPAPTTPRPAPSRAASTSRPPAVASPSPPPTAASPGRPRHLALHADLQRPGPRRRPPGSTAPSSRPTRCQGAAVGLPERPDPLPAQHLQHALPVAERRATTSSASPSTGPDSHGHRLHRRRAPAVRGAAPTAGCWEADAAVVVLHRRLATRATRDRHRRRRAHGATSRDVLPRGADHDRLLAAAT